MECYSKFMLQQIEQTDNLKQLKKRSNFNTRIY